MYRLKFLFDWGSGVCLWSADDATISRFGDYPITTDNLPVSETTKNTIEHLISWHDEALNWNNPSGELLWDEQQVKVFLSEAKQIYKNLCDELGPDYVIEFYDGM